MAYRKSNRYSRALAAARAAKDRKRRGCGPPDYPMDLPELRREVLVIDYDSGRPVVHHWILYRSQPPRVDCHRVEENGQAWRGRWVWSRVLAQVRQRFPRSNAEFARCGRAETVKKFAH